MALATLISLVAGCDTPLKVVAPDGGWGGQIGGTDAGTAPSGAGGMAGSPGCPPSSGASLGIAQHPDEGNNHLVVCSATAYQTIPPSSGSHYPSWPVYKTYTQPVPWGFLMHGLEHGAVEVVYNCPGGCPDEVAAAQAWIDALPVNDFLCPGDPPRVVLAPDPTLDVRWAATAWTWTLRACAFEPATFQRFFVDHYNNTNEKKCRDLSVEVDWSAMNWCQ
ncbi:MAG: DUF3105 domain-containing protein [Myxococcales bacterium]